ncbi:MAG: alanine/glycine:cation symporter family protein [Emergencia sp.]
MNILTAIDSFFANIVPIGDILWVFPQNFDWYAGIPIIGNIPFAIWLLVGMGVFFTFRTRGVQFRFFKTGLKVLTKKKRDDTGVSPLAAFMLSTAMRVGPGNIVGVTGAISLGGPGALFWMWLSALFGMASSFIEATLAQIFKEKDGDEFVGGLPYYGQKLLGGRRWIGVALSVFFIAYAMLSIPIQTFHVFTATGTAVGAITGTPAERTSVLYYVIAVILIVGIALAVFGGIKRVTAVTDRMVPVMAVIYAVIVIGLLLINIRHFPAFISNVVVGAFKPESIFGGGFGIVLSQGIKRGLLSNEAGQGTITMSAAVAEQDHPCEQGFIQSIGVFLDTIIICTLSGFIVCGARLWDGDSWAAIKDSKIDVFLNSLKEMIPGTAMDGALSTIICICYGLFAFTSLLGLVSFACVAGTRISKSKACTNTIRILGALIFVPIGTLCVLAGLELDNIWYVTDLINILLVFANAPIIIYGAKYVYRALNLYIDNGGRRFVASEIGLESDIWTEEERSRIERL